MRIVDVNGNGGLSMGAIKTIRLAEAKKSISSDYKWVLHIALMALMAFSMGRVELMAAFFPCGIALISAALKKNTLNLYLFVPMLLGFITLTLNTSGMEYIWGDFAAMLLCTAFFMISAKKKLSDFARMMVCAGITAVCDVAYHAVSHTIYRLNIPLMLLEIVTVCGFYYVYHVFFALVDKKKAYGGSAEGGIVSISAVWTLAFCGLFAGVEIGNFSVNMPCIAALLCTLVLGYKLGVYAGVTSGATAAIILCLSGAIYTSQVIIFICAGLTAGFFRGLNKYTSAACFAAVCLIFGLTCAGSLGALSSMAPLVASLIFALAPESWSHGVTRLLQRLTRDETAVSDIRTNDIINVLDGYKNCFAQLGQLYNIGKDKRSIVSHQFRGMEQVIDRLEQDIKAAGRGKIAPSSVQTGAKFRIETSASGYARAGSVSGDSYICKRLKQNKYIMILCDGMGKGEAAAIESSLAVKTLSNLIEAGFDTELALHTLNSILLLKSKDEIFSTVDIGIFDSEKASLKLYKIGAASTFIKRGNRVDAVKMAALPMGIVDGLKIDFVNLKLQEGDQIIMVSDGITDSGRHIKSDDNAWLAEAILGVKSKDPATMADLIINRTIENYGVRERDDLTVISAVVKANA